MLSEHRLKIESEKKKKKKKPVGADLSLWKEFIFFSDLLSDGRRTGESRREG